MTNVIEIWLPIPNYEGYYEVSNMGNVRSVTRLVEDSNKVQRILGKDKKPTKNIKNGYLYINLSRYNKTKFSLVHKLVMLAFVGPSNGLDVNHKNGIKTDNRLENLEYCTRSENELHAIRVLGKQHRKGSNKHNAKLTESDIFFIKNSELKSGQLGKMFGVHGSTISHIRSGRGWKHVIQ